MEVCEVRKRIYKGECLSDIFEFTDGQECEIFKGDWNPGDDVIYIPDIDLNGICINRPLINILDEEEIEEIISCLYTGNDFMNLANGNEDIAKRLFYYCDWQHPSSALNEVLDDEEENGEKGETEIDFYPELEMYLEEETPTIWLSRDNTYMSEFKIIFDVDGKKYYCFVVAGNMDEALGIFFRNHPHITYDMVVDYTEV